MRVGLPFDPCEDQRSSKEFVQGFSRLSSFPRRALRLVLFFALAFGPRIRGSLSGAAGNIGRKQRTVERAFP